MEEIKFVLFRSMKSSLLLQECWPPMKSVCKLVFGGILLIFRNYTPKGVRSLRESHGNFNLWIQSFKRISNNAPF